LKFLHPAESLNEVKLMQIENLTTDEIVQTLRTGVPACLKARADGTVLDGHHRLHILRARGIDIDALPREIVTRRDIDDAE
jgi:ParB-like chromosome segregation protein Spo0J